MVGKGPFFVLQPSPPNHSRYLKTTSSSILCQRDKAPEGALGDIVSLSPRLHPQFRHICSKGFPSKRSKACWEWQSTKPGPRSSEMALGIDMGALEASPCQPME